MDYRLRATAKTHVLKPCELPGYLPCQIMQTKYEIAQISFIVIESSEFVS